MSGRRWLEILVICRFQASSKHGIAYLVTKHGLVHLYDMESGSRIYSNRISTDTVFVTCEYHATGGIMGINRKGQVGFLQ